MQFNKAVEHIKDRLRDELPVKLYYHRLEHTLDVMKAAERIARDENVNEYERKLIVTAAAYHDCGYLLKSSNHEEDSIVITRKALPSFGYTAEEIELICKMISCTAMPQKPCGKLEMILCDADLDYLGRDDFFMISMCLYRELNENGLQLTLKEWYKMEIDFLSQHHYYNKSVEEKRGKRKLAYIQQIKELLEKEEEGC